MPLMIKADPTRAPRLSRAELRDAILARDPDIDGVCFWCEMGEWPNAEPLQHKPDCLYVRLQQEIQGTRP